MKRSASMPTPMGGRRAGRGVKNVIALAAGVCDGLDIGDNAKAAMMTRGLTEIARLGVAMGAHSETLRGCRDGGSDCYLQFPAFPQPPGWDIDRSGKIPTGGGEAGGDGGRVLRLTGRMGAVPKAGGGDADHGPVLPHLL